MENNKANNIKTKGTRKVSRFLDKQFKITQRQSTVKGELVGGLVNFLVLVYVMVVLPNILTQSLNSQAMWNAVFLATIITVILTTFSLAFYANLPLVSAPGIGLSSYFATLMQNGNYNFSQTLTIAFIAGVLFILLTMIGFRKKLINSLPQILKVAIPSGIGLFILNIGLNSSNSKIIDLLTSGPTKIINGGVVWQSAVVAIFGFVLIAVLHHKNVKGSIFIGIVSSTVLHFLIQLIVGVNPFASLSGASWMPPFKDLFNNTFFSFDFKGVFTAGSGTLATGILVAVIIIFSYILVDLFDTVGTLYAATKGTSLQKPTGEIEGMEKVFWIDSASTVLGSTLGVPGCTVYVESVAGIKSGARTGLSSLVVAILFIASMFLSPLFVLIPTSATAPALMFVGVLMFSSVLEIDFTKIDQAVPAIFTIITMPLTNNIAHGIGVGLILHTLIMVFTKRAKKVNFITYMLSLMFILFFATQNIF